MEMELLAPRVESYVPEQNFEYTPRQREVDFAQLCASGGDPVESLIKSGIYPAEEIKKLSPGQLARSAARLYSSPAIQERIRFFLKLHHASMDITADRIKQELASVSFVDPALTIEDHAVTDDGGATTLYAQGIRDLRKLPRHVRAAIKEFYIDKDGQPRYKFHDKLKSLQMLADMEGLFNEAHAAKAPTITFNLGGSPQEITDPLSSAIDITPPTPSTPSAPSAIPEFLR